MAGIYETDDEEGGQAPLVPLPTSRRPSRIAVAQYLSLAAGVVLVLAGLLMTLRDECPPGTVKIVRGASVVDDAAGTLSIASFVSPLLSLSARSSLECTPRMRVTVDIRTVPSEPPSVACANQLVCPALSVDWMVLVQHWTPCRQIAASGCSHSAPCTALQALQHLSPHVRTPRKNVKARAPASSVDL